MFVQMMKQEVFEVVVQSLSLCSPHSSIRHLIPFSFTSIQLIVAYSNENVLWDGKSNLSINQSMKHHVLATCTIDVLGWYCNVISFLFINASILIHRKQSKRA